ncbi:MAG: pirin family protein [Steroidobacteraceae bacterium]
MSSRSVNQIIEGMNTSDGAGVKLLRSLGQRQHLRLDPFLMLDEFGSDKAGDYIAGFPPHPHRGFETVTYMLEGHMLHEDHMGNKGHLRNGDVQWMSAAHGIIHSEMPQQQAGRMHGFQLWINLPAREKMKPASYRDIPAAKIPVVQLGNGGTVKIIAGEFVDGEQCIAGPVQGLATQATYLDVHLPQGRHFMQPTPETHNALLYLYQGEISVGEGMAATPVSGHVAALLNAGDRIVVTAASDARFLVLTAQPLNEPVVQYGPFVMNTPEEIQQAILDYQTGKLVQARARAFSE